MKRVTPRYGLYLFDQPNSVVFNQLLKFRIRFPNPDAIMFLGTFRATLNASGINPGQNHVKSNMPLNVRIEVDSPVPLNLTLMQWVEYFGVNSSGVYQADGIQNIAHPTTGEVDLLLLPTANNALFTGLVIGAYDVS